MEQLNQVYTDPKSIGAYGGQSKLMRAVPGLKQKDAAEFLSTQEAYQLTKPPKLKVKTNKTFVHRENEIHEADLSDLSIYKNENDGYRYLLFIIDKFSRKLKVIPLKTKTKEELHAAFTQAYYDPKSRPFLLHTDRGTEFFNSLMQKLYKKLGIKRHYNVYSEKKAASVERVQRTFKGMLMRHLLDKRTKRYISVLNDLTDSYNNTYNRAIGMAPNDVTEANADTVRNRMYPVMTPRKLTVPKYAVGDYVRLLLTRSAVGYKGYDVTWSFQVYQISSVLWYREQIQYKIKDHRGRILKGAFYEPELQKVPGPPTEFRIEKIIRQRKDRRTGQVQYLVRYQGYSSEDDQWITDDQLVI